MKRVYVVKQNPEFKFDKDLNEKIKIRKRNCEEHIMDTIKRIINELTCF